jgi:septal ring factor EnvC (AmiA/AmiB activator)
MMRWTLSMAGVLLLFTLPVCAEDHPEMDAAQHDLESARTHLQAAPHDYAGHRKSAVEAVNHALKDIKEGVAAVDSKEKKVERKENKLQNKEQKLEKRDEKLKQ